METFSALLWRGALIFSLIYAWANTWAHSDDAGDLRRHRTHYDIIVMSTLPTARSHNQAFIQWNLQNE